MPSSVASGMLTTYSPRAIRVSGRPESKSVGLSCRIDAIKTRVSAQCHGVSVLALDPPNVSVSCLAQAQRLIQYSIEYRREVAGRGVDDLQYLGRCGLLLQRLARLGQQPRVFHCDDGLRREILEQSDLL